MDPDYDVLIIGSGFGGSVSALRLIEKGYRVGVLEAGRRFADHEFAKTSWRLRQYLWAPYFRCYGIQRANLLKNIMFLSGAGVGGGSLNYANTLYVPHRPFFCDRQWSHITDWYSELHPHYEQAQRMLGVIQNPTMTDADRILKKIADNMGFGESFTSTPVGVFFPPHHEDLPGTRYPDPYFGGVGPERTSCTECGECMSGCRWGAKNTLVKNYLYLAESAGAHVYPLTTVKKFYQTEDGLWKVHTVRTGTLIRRHRQVFTARHLILAAGTYNTQKLLFKMRDKHQLPNISDRLGVLTRSNSESIVWVSRPTVDPSLNFTHGVAITSSVYPDNNTHIQPVHYGVGSNFIGLFQTLMTDGSGPQGTSVPRWIQLLRQIKHHPLQFARLMKLYRWSERTMILLVMQNCDNSITLTRKRNWLGIPRMTSLSGCGENNPTWIPIGNAVNRQVAHEIGGTPQSTWSEVFNIPLTAHLIGGAVIGDSAETGVIDPYHRVYGYPTLSIMDGAAISANLGVNPSLSIVAQAERALSLWPNKGESDQRPPQGHPYQRMKPIPPRSPVVPAQAYGALRWAFKSDQH